MRGRLLLPSEHSSQLALRMTTQSARRNLVNEMRLPLVSQAYSRILPEGYYPWSQLTGCGIISPLKLPHAGSNLLEFLAF